MSETKFQDELKSSLSEMKEFWDKKHVHLDREELSQLDAVMTQLSFFSKHSSVSECEHVIAGLQAMIARVAEEVKFEEKELQAETHGGQSYTEDELDRINEYAYRCELVQWLQDALDRVYEARPEFKP